MEVMVKKLQAKFKKVREQLNLWDELQTRLISQFRNASHIIGRLQVLQNSNNYGGLNCIINARDALVANQIESLEKILVSMRKTVQLLNGNSSSLIKKQLQLQVGIKPTLNDCLDGLSFLQDIHHSEYLLKSSVISTLSATALKPSDSDLGALQQLLVDQPNLSGKEVQFVFDIIFAEELC